MFWRGTIVCHGALIQSCLVFIAYLIDLIVLLKVRQEKKTSPARRYFQHPAITLCKSWPGMLIHCYLKCIEFPWKMIHSCRLKLINNNDELR